MLLLQAMAAKPVTLMKKCEGPEQRDSVTFIVQVAATAGFPKIP